MDHVLEHHGNAEGAKPGIDPGKEIGWCGEGFHGAQLQALDLAGNGAQLIARKQLHRDPALGAGLKGFLHPGSPLVLDVVHGRESDLHREFAGLRRQGECGSRCQGATGAKDGTCAGFEVEAHGLVSCLKWERVRLRRDHQTRSPSRISILQRWSSV